MTLINGLNKYAYASPMIAILHESEVLFHVRNFRNRWKAV